MEDGAANDIARDTRLGKVGYILDLHLITGAY